MKEFINKKSWKSVTDNPIINHFSSILYYAILLIISLISIVIFIFTINTSSKYFNKNEILFNISEKYTTPKINDQKPFKNDYNFQLTKSEIKFDTESSSEDEKFGLGDIGDFIGGYFGFLIGIVGVLLTFLAFYIQYKANKDVQKQFRLQQFETQFHKMIDVYLNNKDKFSIIGYKNTKNNPIDLNQISGDTNNEKLYILNDFYANQHINFIEFTTKDHIVFQKFLVELKVIYRVFLEAYKEEQSIDEEDINKNIKEKLFKEAYKLFFNGLNQYCKVNWIDLEEGKDTYKRNFLKKRHIIDDKIFDIESSIIGLYDKILSRIESNKTDSDDSDDKKIIDVTLNYDLKIKVILLLDNLRNIHKINGTKVFENFYHDGIKHKKLWLKLNYTPFKGYLHFLPQYYRNLFSIVKYVVTDNPDLNLTQNEKSKYLRILRSTMSEHEQTLLFYNWLSDTGSEWENHENKFFSDWKMIDNLNSITLIDEDLNFDTIPSN